MPTCDRPEFMLQELARNKATLGCRMTMDDISRRVNEEPQALHYH